MGTLRRTARRAHDRVLPILIAIANWYLGDHQFGSGAISTGPYHADRVFRTWR